MRGARGLPEHTVSEVLRGSPHQSVVLASAVAEPWFGPVASYAVDIISLCWLCRVLQPRTVFEIGTLRGYTTLHLALNTPADATVYTLDLPKAHSAWPLLRTTVVDDAHIRASASAASYVFEGYAEAEGKIRCVFGDSATYDFSPYHGLIDLFFIDGAHSYDYVRSDTLNAMRCCAPGGVIAWHEFGRAGVNGVGRWLRELAASGRP